MIVRESISFERGKDPKSAMSIGVAAGLNEYKENLSDWAIIDAIIEDSDLTTEVKKIWIVQLLKEDHEKYEMTEDAMYWANENNFDYLTPIPDGGGWYITSNIGLNKISGQWIVSFDDWQDWAVLIMKNAISEEFLEGVLNGDAFQFFESHEQFLDTADIINLIEKNLKNIGSWNYLEDLYIEMGGEEDRGNVGETISSIWSDDKFENLKVAIEQALMSADESSREGEAYKHIKAAIVDYYELGTEMYDDKSQTYKVNTMITGADKLVKASILGSDYHIDYSRPRDDYQAEMDIEVFDEELENKLENLFR